MEFNPLLLDIESKKVGIMDVAKELGIAIVAWSPLAMGLVTGRFVRVILSARCVRL